MVEEKKGRGGDEVPVVFFNPKACPRNQSLSLQHHEVCISSCSKSWCVREGQPVTHRVSGCVPVWVSPRMKRTPRNIPLPTDMLPIYRETLDAWNIKDWNRIKTVQTRLHYRLGKSQPLRLHMTRSSWSYNKISVTSLSWSGSSALRTDPGIINGNGANYVLVLKSVGGGGGRKEIVLKYNELPEEVPLSFLGIEKVMVFW